MNPKVPGLIKRIAETGSCASSTNGNCDCDRVDAAIYAASYSYCQLLDPDTWFITRVHIQTAPRSVRPFLHGSRSWPTDRQTHTHRPRYMCNDRAPHDAAWGELQTPTLLDGRESRRNVLTSPPASSSSTIIRGCDLKQTPSSRTTFAWRNLLHAPPQMHKMF